MKDGGFANGKEEERESSAEIDRERQQKRIHYLNLVNDMITAVGVVPVAMEIRVRTCFMIISTKENKNLNYDTQ